MVLNKTLCGLLILIALSACGIKPKYLAPPSAKLDENGNVIDTPVTFPRVYPDPHPTKNQPNL